MSTDYQDPKRSICLKHAVKFRRNTRFNENDRNLLRDYNLDEKEVAKGQKKRYDKRRASNSAQP